MKDQPIDHAERLAAFSTWLTRERELRGLSRGDVLQATRLAPQVVDALEGGEPSRLPPRAYVLGYLRAYAVAAGLDADEVVLRFEEAAGGAVAAARGARRRAVPFRMSLLAAVAVVVVVAAAALWLLLRG